MTAQHSTAQHSTAQHSTLCAVIPSIPQDIGKVLKNTDYFFRYLPITKIYVIGPADIAENIARADDSRIIFMNENEFVDAGRIRGLYSSRTDKNPNRAGWYIQQFIKMQFARFTSNEYYLIWDSDTIPVRHIDFFNNNGTPILDLRLQQIPSYYRTMTKLLPNIAAPYHKSFVTEHMLVNSQHMRECLSDIEANSLIAGSSFQEKVINAVDIDDLPFMGFSEYETYGMWSHVIPTAMSCATGVHCAQGYASTVRSSAMNKRLGLLRYTMRSQ